MKVIFIGCLESSRILLERTITTDIEVVGVITREKSGFNADFVDLSSIAERHNIPWRYFSNVNSQECIDWVSELETQIVFCFGWSFLIKKALLEATPLGVIGFHPTALPANRGRHPLIWPLVLGMKKTASSFFFMDEGADSGDIVSQVPVNIEENDYAADLYERVMIVAAKQLESFIPKLIDKTFDRVPQDHTSANNWRKRGKPDGEIDFRMNSQTIYNLVRALSKPYVGAHLHYNGKDVKIWKVNVVKDDRTNMEFGKVLESNDVSITVKTADGAIEIIEHEFDNTPLLGEYI